MAYQQPDPFWDFIRSFDPNVSPSTGNGQQGSANNGPAPEFIRGFPFFHHPGAGAPVNHGPGGRHHPRSRRHHGPPPPEAWAGPFGFGGWSGEGHPWFQQQQQQQQRPEQARQQPEQQAQPAQQPAQQQAKPQDEKEKPGSPDTMSVDTDAPDPAEVTPDEDEEPTPNPSPFARGHCRRGRRHRDCRSDNNTNTNSKQQPPFPFDLSALFNNLSSHPIIRDLQQAAASASNPSSSSSPPNTFTPPLDLFSTPTSYVLHLPLPGALKPDIGVDWDPERQTLRVAGVVHRPGDEEFQATLVQGERRVGEFAREMKLPPPGAKGEEKEEIDADGITAKLEDGVLVVVVPKVEREWTEIRKVDIE